MPGIIASILAGRQKGKGPNIHDHKVVSGAPPYHGSYQLIMTPKSNAFDIQFAYDTDMKMEYFDTHGRSSQSCSGVAAKDTHFAWQKFDQQEWTNANVSKIVITQTAPTATTEKTGSSADSDWKLGWLDARQGSEYGISQSDSKDILDIMYHK